MKKRLFIYVFIFILSLVSISLFGGSASYAFFFAVVLFPIISLLYVFLVIICFRIYQKTDGRTMLVDEETGYYFTLQNNFPFVFSYIKVEMFSNFFTINDPVKKEPYSLLPGETVSFDSKISCKYRGEYPIGVKSVVIYDFLYLYHLRYTLRSTLNAIVKPKITILNELRSLNGEMLSDLPMQGEGAEFVDASVRDYVSGDSIKKIHWKATAKTGALKVRNMYDEKRRGVSLYFDGKRVDADMAVYLPIENKMLETVIALTKYFTNQNEEVDIKYGDRARAVVNEKDFNEFYNDISEFIFKLDCDDRTNRNVFYDEVSVTLPKIAYYVVNSIDDELLIETQKLSSQSVRVVIYVISDEWDEKYRDYHMENRQIIVINSDADINDIC